MIRFILPRPPSVNNLFITNRAGRRAISRPYRVWRDEAYQRIMVGRVGQPWPIEGRYSLTLTVERGKGDLGNFEKAVSDALVHMGIVGDDKDAERIVMQWGDVAGCVVTVEAV